MTYKNIKIIRESRKMTQQAAAEILNMPLPTYRSYETGTREPNIEFLTAFADRFDVTVDYILEHHVNVDTFSEAEKAHIGKYRSLDSYGKNVVDMVLAAECERVQNQEQERGRMNIVKTVSLRINDNSVSAGFGNILDDYENWDTVLVPLTPESRKADFILRVSGDSMEPMFSDGDCVLVHRQECIEQGEIGIFCVNDNGYIKKLGKNVLISLNKKYPEIPLDNDSRCFGKVLGKAEILD